MSAKTIYVIGYWDPTDTEGEVEVEPEVFPDLQGAVQRCVAIQEEGFGCQVVEVVVDPKGEWEDVESHETGK